MTNAEAPLNFLNLPQERIKQFRKGGFAVGILFILIGIAAMALPAFATIGIELFIATLLLAIGLLQLTAGILSRGSRSGWFGITIGLLAAIAGAYMLANPEQGAMALTALLAVWFTLGGAVRLANGLQFKPAPGSGWTIVSGILSLAIAALIVIGWPGSSLIILGVFFGIDMLFFGISLVALASAVGK